MSRPDEMLAAKDFAKATNDLKEAEREEMQARNKVSDLRSRIDTAAKVLRACVGANVQMKAYDVGQRQIVAVQYVNGQRIEGAPGSATVVLVDLQSE